MSTPASRIYVCSGVAINNSYAHTIYFESKQAQKRYFSGKIVKTFNQYTYLRRNFDIKVEAEITSAQFWNYLFFDNPDGKTYYYFITSVEYKSDTTVVLHLEMDVIQTYMFDWELKPCFIERMTPASDEIGENTIEEGLELGELITTKCVNSAEYDYYYLMVMTTFNLNKLWEDNENVDAVGCVIGEVYSGCFIYCIDPDNPATKIDALLDKVQDKGLTDGVVAMWMYPKNMVELSETGSIRRAINIKTNEYVFQGDKAIKDYTPKNNKLLTYPYNFLHVHNNLGTSADYRFERFPGFRASNNYQCNFEIDGSLFPDGGLKLTPVLYNGGGFKDYEYGLTLTGFPTVAWVNDTYKIWLAQNQNQQQAQATISSVSSVAGTALLIAGTVTANPALIGTGIAMAAGGVASIGTQLAQTYDMKSTPDQARGMQSSSVNAMNRRLNFTFAQRCITPERARIIDNYFTMFGYKQLIVDTPSIHNRQLFTYIKTNGCFVVGELCNDDREKIASVFDKGVTFWTDGDKVGNYHETNGFLES